MLPKKYRLPAYLIPRLLKKGQRLYSKNLTLVYQKPTSPKSLAVNHCSRFAFAVSIKLSKKAVLRNKLKRQLSCLVQKNLDQLKKDYNLLLLVKKNQLINEFSQISDEVITLFKQARVLEEK